MTKSENDIPPGEGTDCDICGRVVEDDDCWECEICGKIFCDDCGNAKITSVECNDCRDEKGGRDDKE